MEKTNQAMTASRLMALFHLSFTLLSLAALFLMAADILTFDWIALWLIVLAVALNAFFGVMWYDETGKRKTQAKTTIAKVSRIFPMVSVVIPAHNQETNISNCIKSVFNCALNYRGPSEIIIIDDGSTDNTYELAWSTLSPLKEKMPQIHTRVLKHLAALGKEEAVRTGANKAMGEYVVLLETTVPCDYVSLDNLIDTIFSTQETMVSFEVSPPPQEGKITAKGIVQLYRADALRRTLNEEHAGKAVQELQP